MHILTPESKHIFVPTAANVKGAKEFASGKKVKYTKVSDGVMLELDQMPDEIDYVVELSTIND